MPFRKIVVTDDQGRFLVPDLPDGAYELWVRGYGLKDSDRVKAARGEQGEASSCQRRNSARSGEDLSCQLLDVADSASLEGRSPRRVQDPGAMACGLADGCNHCHELGMVATRRYTTVDDWDAIFSAQSRHASGSQSARQGYC